jgi:pyrroloquinoline quinone (PQQ) biosynthesis protein C
MATSASATRRPTDILAALDRARAEINVLEHPFYRRWRAGCLRPCELETYAAQYRHAVLALAEASHRAAEEAPADDAPGLRAHAQEEAGHVALWDRFADAASGGARVAGSPDVAPFPETAACARAWTAAENLLERLAVLYAIEASQPAISDTKLAGLVQHYGYRGDAPAVDYFRVHALRDHEHARMAAELIERLVAADGDDHHARRAVSRGRAALRANWRLLDGVDAAAPPGSAPRRVDGARGPSALRA